MEKDNKKSNFLRIMIVFCFLAVLSITTVQAKTTESALPGWKFDAATGVLYILDDTAFAETPEMYNDGIKYWVTTLLWDRYLNQITSIVVSEGVQTLPGAIFADLANLEQVHLPESLVSINSYAFYNCPSLQEITIPDAVESIGFEAFYQCKSLKKVVLGRNVESLEENVFSQCDSLKQIQIPADQPYFCLRDGILYTKDKKRLVLCPAQRKGTVTIPDSVEVIGEHAFGNCRKLTKVMISKNVERIYGGAFYNCSGLKEVIFDPKSKCEFIYDFDKYYGDETWEQYGTFEGCSSLKSITFPDSLIGSGQRAINNCKSLQSIHLGRGFRYFSSTDFYYKLSPYTYFGYKGLDNITTITVSNKNKFFLAKDNVLYDKKQTVLYWYPQNKPGYNFTVPKSVHTIEAYAFRYNQNLTEIDLSNCKTVDYEVFLSSRRLERVSMGNKLTTIEESAFQECLKLKEVQWSKRLKKIGRGAFLYCENLVEFIAYGNQTEIGGSAFRSCKRLHSVTLKEGTKAIWNDAFMNCPALKKLVIPSSVKNINQDSFGTVEIYKGGQSRSVKVKGFVLYCKKNSAAYEYAKKVGLKYKIIS